MKKLIYSSAMVFSLAVFGAGCEKYFEGINDNPNDLTDVTPNLLLPSSQSHLAYGLGGDMSRLTTMLMQQCTGVDRQWATYQQYNITETETDNFWRFNLYGGPLQDLHLLIANSETNGYNHYAGIGKVMMAYGLLATTDLFGDVPYSEAFQGSDNAAPSFDSQEEVYGTVQTLLTDAKNLFAGDAGDLVPGDDDRLYAGDVTLWTKLANVLSAKAHLHLGKVSSSHYADALTALGVEGTDCFGSNADDAAYWFGAGETEAAPWYQFLSQRVGDIDFTGWMLDTLLVLGDPRLASLVDTAGGAANMGTYYARPDAPYEYATYAEQKFIEAEAAFKTGDLARAASAHNAAVMASLNKFGVAGANPAFETAEANETAGTVTLKKIMVHKYLATFTSVDVFADWRRTGFPALQAVSPNITGDVIPRRLPLPQSERLYNSNAPAGASIVTPVWWDM